MQEAPGTVPGASCFSIRRHSSKMPFGITPTPVNEYACPPSSSAGTTVRSRHRRLPPARSVRQQDAPSESSATEKPTPIDRKSDYEKASPGKGYDKVTFPGDAFSCGMTAILPSDRHLSIAVSVRFICHRIPPFSRMLRKRSVRSISFRKTRTYRNRSRTSDSGCSPQQRR